MKNKIIKRSSMIWAVPLITLIVILLIFSLPKIILIGPKGHITDTNPLFRWNTIHGYSYYQLLVDDNPEFTSPSVIETKDEEYRINNMSVGDYFWKVIGYNKNKTESNTESFSVDSVVALAREKNGVRNTGNVAILLDLFRNGLFTGRAIVDVNNDVEIKNATDIEAIQK